MAGSRLMSISQDERERAVFRSRRMYQTDLQSDLATAEDRGRRQGILTIAKNLLAMDMPHDQIVAATGLTLEELESISL